jgi:hypothetical protein
MKHLIAMVLACVSAAASPAKADGAVTIDQLAWIGGTWVAERDGRWTEEHWTAPRGGLMLGVNRNGAGDLARGFEFLRIQTGADGVVTYWAAPAGQPPVPFRLTASSADSVTFENPQHDYPAIITYRRDGDRLQATIAGPGGARPMSWTWQRR